MARRQSKKKRKPAGATPTRPPSSDAASPLGRDAQNSATPPSSESSTPPSGGTDADSPDDAFVPTGWKAFLWVVAGGILLGLSQPLVTPWTGQDPVLPGISGLLAFIGMVPLFVVVRGASAKRTYWFAFAAVFVQMWILLYWIIIAMTVFGKIPTPISMLALSALAAAIAFGIAAPFAVAHVIRRAFPIPYWVLAPMAVTGLELIRNNGPFGGFPWGNVGNSLATIPLLVQGASLFGVYGLLFCIVLVNAALAEIYIAYRRKTLAFDGPARALAAVAILLVGWGALRLATSPDATAPTVRVGLLQANIEKGIKNEEFLNRRKILDTFHKLQAEALELGAEIVVWPEASLPTTVKTTAKSLRNRDVVHKPRSTRRRDKNGKMKTVKPKGPPPKLPPAGIIGGTASFKVTGVDGKRHYRHYNSAFATTKNLEIVGRFDKSHLVPFGEYIPWPAAGVVSHFVAISSEAGAGLHPVKLPVNGRDINVAATICYEGAFPEISRALANEGAELMFNVTNDSWYGISSMAHQHLALYSLRAVENGRAVARVANTGISAWIDSRGNIHDATPMYETTVVVADVPVLTGTTPYRVLGDWVAYPCMLLTLLLWFAALIRRGVQPRKPVELVIAVMSGAIIVGALLPLYGTHESLVTMRTVAVIAALLTGLGAYSGRPWGRRAQMILGVVAVVVLTPGLVTGTTMVIPFGVFFIGAGILAKQREQQYRLVASPRDP